jgi:hypothetical protein
MDGKFERQIKDIHLKSLIKTYRPEFLVRLGFSRKKAAGAAEQDTNLIRDSLSIMHPDALFRLPDGAFVVIEFQTTSNPSDIGRFFRYASTVADNWFVSTGAPAEVWACVVYTAGAGALPPKTCLKDASLKFELRQTALADAIGAGEILERLAAAAEGRRPKLKDGFPLSRDEILEVLLAPYGKLPDDAEAFFKRRLDFGLRMARMYGKPDFLLGMMISVGCWATTEPYIEELKAMDVDYDAQINELTGGKYLKYKEECLAYKEECLANARKLEDNARELEDKDRLIEAKDIAIELAIAAKDSAGSRLAAAVRALHESGDSAEDIASRLTLKLPDVRKILRTKTKPAARLSAPAGRNGASRPAPRGRKTPRS